MGTVCQSCGTRQDDWFEPAANGRWQPINPPRWEAEEHICAGCAEVGRLRKHLGDEAGIDKGVTIRLAPTKPPGTARGVGR